LIVSAPNIPELNFKSLREWICYEIICTVDPSDGDVKLDGPLGVFG
jgi:hypothetical protein